VTQGRLEAMMEIVSVQGLPFLACLVMLAMLAYIGIHVLKREIIFIDIALAQIAAVGAIAAHVIFHFHGHSVYAHVLAFGSTVIAAAFFAVVRRRVVQIPLEAVIGVSYAVSAAAALFLVGVAPGGHVHIQEMLAGSILWATWSQIVWSACVFAAVGVCFYIFRKPFRSISDNYEGAVATGYNTQGWDFLFYTLVGVVITMAVRIAGVVVVFTFLIIPATLSATFASGWTGRLLVAWVAGAVSSALGLLFADRYDFSVGPAIALFLGAALVVIGLLRAVRVARVAAAAAWVVISVVLGAWFAVGSIAGDSRVEGGFGGAPNAGSITHSHVEAGEPPGEHTHEHSGQPAEDSGIEDQEITADWLSAIADSKQLEVLYARAADVEERSLVACRTLEVDAKSGARMAIEILAADPPLLFRATIVDKLEETAGREVPYDIDQPFDAPANQQAVARLKESLGLD
jgi:zinc/manganese transport system permease protein